jgi:pimeloyl-ACP methyl ester carboxylesterase
MAVEREETTFTSGTDDVAAWHYGGAGDACVVMAHGFSLTRHDGLDVYAQAIAAAGPRVLVFDHRYLGDSGGMPRQHFSKRAQLEDWRNAVAHARGLDGVDPGRIVLWGYSFAGGHVTTLAAEDPRLAAVIALCPFVNGVPRLLRTTPAGAAWLLPRALLSLAGSQVRIPVTGPPGSHAAMTLPGEADGFARTVTASSPWRNEIAPGVFATVAFHRPLARAGRVRCPVWVGAGERDVSVDFKSAEKYAARAPRGEFHRYPYDHFEPFYGDGPARIAADQIDFLRRHGLAT